MNKCVGCGRFVFAKERVECRTRVELVVIWAVDVVVVGMLLMLRRSNECVVVVSK